MFIIVCIAGVGLVLYLLYQAARVLITAWTDFERRRPRLCLAIKLVTGMALVAGALALAGFDSAVQLSGALLVPGLWGWFRLTSCLPLIFLPLNASLIGSVLWLVARLTRDAWQPVWSELTRGLPLIGDLAVVLGAVPMVMLVMHAGMRHYPRVFRVIDLIGFGLILAFVLTRVWTGWVPLWAQWTEPLPLIPAPGVLIAAAPLLIWLWRQGQKRWPTPFFAANLLLLGGALSLTAYQYQPLWRDAWNHWTAGTVVATMPFVMIAVTPVSLWTWSRVSLRWPRIFALPNQLLNGAILWLIADRTRALWTNSWLRFWGDVPIIVDPALMLLALPATVWGVRRAGERWSPLTPLVRLLLLSVLCWWLAERTRFLWQDAWSDFAGSGALDPALLALVFFPLLVGWGRLRRRWTMPMDAVGLSALTMGLWWVAERTFPETDPGIRAAIATVPLASWGWMLLFRHRRQLALALVGLLALLALLAAWLLPEYRQATIEQVLRWVAIQDIRLP
ncbi:MAG: hypothetical protein RMJ48_01660 [Roseiflexaceae bacterium]|nr:hypothetical protein [Roseiflexaceae bacterium]